MKSLKIFSRLMAVFVLVMLVNMKAWGAEVAFNTPLYNVNLNGDMTTLGNTIIWKDTAAANAYGVDVSTSTPTDRNNAYTMKFVDVLSDGSTTFNSSSSSLTLAAGYTVKWAGLYWQGHIVNTGLESSADNSKIGTGNNANAIYNNAKSLANTVYFKLPSGSNYTLTAQVYYDYPTDLQGNTDQRYLYSGFYDVTNYVKAGGNGIYTVGNIRTSEGQIDTWGGLGGWAMVVIYEDPTGALQLKNISVFNGYRVLNSGQTQDITVNGFLTPSAGTLNASLAVFVVDGDKLGSNSTGEHLKMRNPSNVLTDITNVTNPLNNVFNSSITNMGVDNVTRTPFFSDNLGIDIDRFNVSSYMKYGQTNTQIQLSTSGDLYAIDMIAFATDIYRPNICYVENIFKGTTNISGVGAQVNQDDNLTVRVYIKNMGNELANGVQISHQFDSSFPYAANSANYNNSNPPYETAMPPSYSRTTASDTAGNDLYEYSSTSLTEKVNLGSGATSSSGGTFYPMSSINPSPTYAVFEYNGTVKVVDNNYSNVYKAAYANSALGIDYSANPITLSSCTGLTNSFYGINAAPIPAIGFDARETSIAQADNNRSITTKIANEPMSLNVVSLATDGSLGQYTGINNNRIYLFTVDTAQCSLPEADRLVLISSKPRDTYVTFQQGDYSHVSPAFTNIAAGKDKKIMMNFINWNQEFIDATFTCSNSNTQAVLNGVPQCLNSDSKLAQVFPNLVTACLSTGARPACQSSSYANGVPSAPYDNEFGCYQCLAGGAGSAECSTDNFAIRPDRFEFTATGLMKAGEDYNITTYAKNYNSTSNTQDYNQSVSNLTSAPRTWWQRDTNVALNTTTYPVHGLVSIIGDWNTSNGVGMVPVRFSDVGRFTLDLNDTNWAMVDIGDTALSNRTIHGEGNVTFIPWDFNISVGGIRNNNGLTNSFTYLSNDLNISARIALTIQAQNKQGFITQNYSDNMYERNITMTPHVSSVVATTLGLTPLIGIIANKDLNFTSGAKSIVFNDTNVPRFNFTRNQQVPVSPFDVNSSNGIGNDVNITSIDSDSVYGDKNQTLDGNATFIYGRTHAAKQRYNGSTGIANIYYEAYCFGANCLKSRLPNGNASINTDDLRWFINQNHSTATDGNIIGAITEINGLLKVTATVATAANPSKTTLTYSGANYPYKTTMQNGASSWLLYDPNNPLATKNEFQVEFGSGGEWSGEHNTSTTTKNVGATKANRRTNW